MNLNNKLCNVIKNYIITNLLNVNSSYLFIINVLAVRKSTKKLEEEIASLQNQIALLTQKEIKETWLDSYDIKSKFNISESTLYRMRKNKQIPFTKFGSRCLYPSSYFDKSLFQKLENKDLM